MKALQKQIEKLLVIAKVPPDKLDKARQELNWRIRAARKFSSGYRKQKNPQEHNEYFEDIERSATSLIAAIKRVETNEHAALHFWWEWQETWGEAPKQVFGTLDRIVKSARDSKRARKPDKKRWGRPELLWKQALVDGAYFAFHSIKSPELRATERGEFYQFAMTFCEAAAEGFEGEILLQVRKALKGRSQQK
jgi:hypothetical protein